MRRHIFRKAFLTACVAAATVLALPGCTDYLDKSIDSEISESEAYKNFTNFQGFVEELYNCIPDFSKKYWNNNFNWGEDEIINVGVDYLLGYQIDHGNFWAWQREHTGWGDSNVMDGTYLSTSSDDRFGKSLWRGCWYGIRKCNLGIQNLDQMMGTEEEKNLIKGQLYFFRAWFHFELIQYFGGLPYIDKVLAANETIEEPRLTYAECAEKCAADFQTAADCLPLDWDETQVGKNTYGQNQLRINKIMALAYLGKNYLWAGSPLMCHERTIETANELSYDKDYCAKAADAFGKVLKLVEDGKTKYGLLPFDEYQNNFFTLDQNGVMPGQSKDQTVTEAIFRGPTYGSWNTSNLAQDRAYGGEDINDAGVVLLPTANYVNYFGMANGLPLDAVGSGFDKTRPWKGRDPRFYVDIVFDGEKMISGTLSSSNEKWRYAQLYTDGLYRNVIRGSRTGYFNYKFITQTCNKFDNGYGYAHAYHLYIPYMRLADVYLMYAEAVAAANENPQAGAASFDHKTAVYAINKVRERAGVADLSGTYATSYTEFMPEMRRERAVELAFEGHRFNDLRRWLLLDKAPYNVKTSQEFIRDGEYNTKASSYDPKNNRVVNFHEVQILKRDFTTKHYWLPLKKDDCSLYDSFQQNPAW